MILAAHQPGYLPSISFFQKMLLADVLVLTDDFQFTTDSEINRTQIKSIAGAKWLTVPVRTKRVHGQRIKEVIFDGDQDWQRKHWKSIEINYRFAAFFEQFDGILEQLYKTDWRFLLDLNLTAIDLIKSAFNIKTEVKLSSELDQRGKGSLKLIHMAHDVGATTFLSDQRYREYLDCQAFEANDIRLEFFTFESRPYHQQFNGFLPGLSIIDLLFNEGKDGYRFIASGKLNPAV